MAENVRSSDLNLPELTRSRILTVPDVQGKSHCPRALSPRVAALAAVLAVMMLLVLIALYLTLRAAGSQQDSTPLTSTSQNGVSTPLYPTSQNGISTPLYPTSKEDSTMLPPSPGEAPGKSCCSTTRVAVLVTEIILLLLSALFQIIPCNRPCSRAHIAVLVVVLLLALLALTLSWTLPDGPNAGSQNSSTTLTSTSQEAPTTLFHIPEAPGCPTLWKKHGRKCYFFSPERKKKDWNSSRAECTAKGSDLVIIESREELNYLLSQSRGSYYILGLRYSLEEQKWKWINNMEHDPAIFKINGTHKDYHCTTIGFGEVGAAPCSGTRTTQNMCEKTATMSERHQKHS